MVVIQTNAPISRGPAASLAAVRSRTRGILVVEQLPILVPPIALGIFFPLASLVSEIPLPISRVILSALFLADRHYAPTATKPV
jgi:hypothetical protein